jgi:hypothetical protein
MMQTRRMSPEANDGARTGNADDATASDSSNDGSSNDGSSNDGIEIVWHPVAGLTGGGFAVGDAATGYVVVDPALDEWHRRTVIEHERVHLERGITTTWPQAPASWAAVTAREELLVNREAARRLAPEPALRTLVAQACTQGEAVTASSVAVEFGITHDLATVALELLAADGHP